MKNKKLLTLLLAVIMVASLAVAPVYADRWDATVGSAPETTITGEVNQPSIMVSVPTKVALVVNPYKLSMAYPTRADATPDATPETTNAQIISNDQFVVNLGASNVNVKMTVKGNTVNGVTYVMAPPADTVLLKQYHIYLETKTIDGSGGSLAPEATPPAVKWLDGYKAPKAALYKHTDKITSQALFNGLLVDLGNVATLAKADRSAAETSTGDFVSASVGDIVPDQYGWLAFTIKGGCTKAPTTAWTAADKPTADVVFTFSLTDEAPSHVRNTTT